MSDSGFLKGYSDIEKGAYLGAIASLATADRTASQEEMEHISELCDEASLTPKQKEAVFRAATELSGEELTRCLDQLKNSNLKYSLVADLMTFAKSDNDYSEQEEKSISKISNYLGVDQQQFSLLDQFAEKASNEDVQALSSSEPQKSDGLESIFGGLKEKLQGAGIDSGSLLKGLLAIGAPLLMSRMFSRGGRSRSGSGMGNSLGGLAMGGGLASVIGMLSGGRGMSGLGGLLGRRMQSGGSW